MEKLLNKILCISSLLLLVICCKPIVKSLGPLASPSVEESKKRGVFLWEYDPVSVWVSDSLNFKVLKVYAERGYQHKSYEDLSYLVYEDSSQILLFIDKNLDSLNHFHSWKLECFTRSFKKCLIRDFDTAFPPDSILINIYKARRGTAIETGSGDKIILGSFILNRRLKQVKDFQNIK